MTLYTESNCRVSYPCELSNDVAKYDQEEQANDFKHLELLKGFSPLWTFKMSLYIL